MITNEAGVIIIDNTWVLGNDEQICKNSVLL